MFWRRTDQEKVEGPADLVLPVREADHDDLAHAPGEIIAIKWYGPFTGKNDEKESELSGKPLVYVVTDVHATATSKPTDVVERIGFSKKGDVAYIKERLTSATALVWIGVGQNLHEVTLPPSDTFEPGDPDARDESEFDAHLALARRVFSYVLRPRLAGILISPVPLPPPLRIRNFWNTKRPAKNAFSGYCPNSISFFKNDKVRLAWDDQQQFFTWTARKEARPGFTANARDDDEPQRKMPWTTLVALSALVAIIGLLGLGIFSSHWSLPNWSRGTPSEASPTTEPSAEITRLNQLLDAANQKIAGLTAELQKAAIQAQELKSQLSVALAKITQLENENQALRASGQGIELKSCWSREGERTTPVYRVAIHDDGFAVEPSWTESEAGWPAPFSDKMGALKPIASTTLSTADFAEAMAPYYALGQKPDMNCRFFVDVSDQTTSKETWKEGLALVERYFYKRLIP